MQIEVLFCGICHSDPHQVRNEWQKIMPTVYPCVAGHEIFGRVTKTGGAVRKFKEGDLAAVGCLVDSCRTCSACREGLEQFCEGPATFTYNAPDKHLGGVTYGGYSDSLVVDEAFALRVSDRLDPAGAATLLCAGITTFSPLKRWNVRKGQKVGVVGLGGLGHMDVKLAPARGNPHEKEPGGRPGTPSALCGRGLRASDPRRDQGAGRRLLAGAGLVSSEVEDPTSPCRRRSTRWRGSAGPRSGHSPASSGSPGRRASPPRCTATSP